MSKIDKLKKRLEELKIKRTVLQNSLQMNERKIEELEDKLENLSLLLQKGQDVAKAMQQIAHKKISSIVSKCLTAVFDDPYEFEIIFEQKRNKTEAKPIFKRDGYIIEDPLSASGGGVIDVASFALRLAAIVLSKPSKRKILILDEPFKFVSKKYRSKIGQILTEIAEGYGVQIIMVTHIEELKTGLVCSLN